MLSLKSGVKLAGLQPEILIGLMVVAEVLRNFGYETVITAATDGDHMEKSLHYRGLALDIRSHDINRSVVRIIVDKVKLALGENFDFLLERQGEANEHFHLEYDPK